MVDLDFAVGVVGPDAAGSGVVVSVDLVPDLVLGLGVVLEVGPVEARA